MVQELAIATANAIAAIAADCTVSGDGFACVWADSSIRTVVEATAEAFAIGFASSVKSCKPECAVNATEVASAITTVVAEAATEAYLDQCTGPDSSFTTTIIESDLVETTVAAVANAIATVRLPSPLPQQPLSWMRSPARVFCILYVTSLPENNPPVV